MHYRSALTLLAVIVSLCRAEDPGRRVSILEGYVTVNLPAGWEVIDPDGKCRIGPRGSPFVSISYAELRASETVDLAYLNDFVRKNLKITKSEELSGGRVLGHGVQNSGTSEEDHQWNVAKVIDNQNLAVVLVGIHVGADKNKIFLIVDDLVRSVELARITKAKQ